MSHAKCGKADSCTVAKNVKMLNDDKCARLEHVLKNGKSSFDGALGGWVGNPHKIKLKDNVEPCHTKPFPVPHAHEKRLRMEVDRPCETGVLKRVNHFECASPSFTMPRKTRQSGSQMILEN